MHMTRLRAHNIAELKVIEPSSEVRDQAFAALKPHSQAVANMALVDADNAFMTQPDLMYVEAVLVTEGINDNDDAFTHAELWKAQSTPVLKPINVGHNDTAIVGVMYGVTARKLDGSPVTEDDGEPFELVMHGVVWHYLPHLKGAAANIAERFAQGQCFVSMECWFEGYDYGLYDDEGKLEDVQQRSDATAFLEGHLRVSGGSGNFNGNRIGRALRGITFGGVAFVDVPANRRSDVLNVFIFDPDEILETVGSRDSNSTNDISDNVVLFQEGFMNDTTNKAVAHSDADVRKVVAESVEDVLNRDRERAQAEAEKKELDAARSKVTDLQTELKEARAALASAHEAVEDGYQTVRAQAGATGDTPEEIARIDRAKDGSEAFSAKIAFIAQTGGRAQASVSDELTQLRDENEKLQAQVREHTRAGEIRETFAGVLSDDEIDGLVNSGLAKSDEDYTAWLDEHKLTMAKVNPFMKGKEGDEKKKDDKKSKGRIMTPADEKEELKDHGVKLDGKHGSVPSSVPSKSLAGIEEHFEEVEDDVNLEGADAGATEESGNPFDKVVADIYSKPRQERRDRFSRSMAELNEGGN